VIYFKPHTFECISVQRDARSDVTPSAFAALAPEIAGSDEGSNVLQVENKVREGLDLDWGSRAVAMFGTFLVGSASPETQFPAKLIWCLMVPILAENLSRGMRGVNG